MRVEDGPGKPVPSNTVEYGGTQIPVTLGEVAYGSKDVISDGDRGTTSPVIPVTAEGVIFKPRNPDFTDGDGVKQEFPSRMKIHF